MAEIKAAHHRTRESYSAGRLQGTGLFWGAVGVPDHPVAPGNRHSLPSEAKIQGNHQFQPLVAGGRKLVVRTLPPPRLTRSG